MNVYGLQGEDGGWRIGITCAGDSNVDVLTGHNAGLKSAGVTWGFRGRAELEAAGADYVVDNQDELAALILGE